jgi:hypothetical protein
LSWELIPYDFIDLGEQIERWNNEVLQEWRNSIDWSKQTGADGWLSHVSPRSRSGEQLELEFGPRAIPVDPFEGDSFD